MTSIQRTGSVHAGGGEDVLGNVGAIVSSGCPFDHQPEQHVADVQ